MSDMEPIDYLDQLVEELRQAGGTAWADLTEAVRVDAPIELDRALTDLKRCWYCRQPATRSIPPGRWAAPDVWVCDAVPVGSCRSTR